MPGAGAVHCRPLVLNVRGDGPVGKPVLLCSVPEELGRARWPGPWRFAIELDLWVVKHFAVVHDDGDVVHAFQSARRSGRPERAAPCSPLMIPGGGETMVSFDHAGVLADVAGENLA